MTDIDRNHADEQRDRGNHLEIDQALQTDASNTPQISVPGDSRDESSEDQRRDDHLDQSQENIAEQADVLGNVRLVESNFGSEQHREKNPIRKPATPASYGHRGEAGPAHDHDPGVRAEENRQEGADEEEEQAIEKLNENPSGIERDFYLDEVLSIVNDYINQMQFAKAK